MMTGRRHRPMATAHSGCHPTLRCRISGKPLGEGMMYFRLGAALGATLLATGCASIVNDTTQPIRIDTVTAEGSEAANADCKMTNDYGTFTARSGQQSTVRRSGKDLDIVCTDPAQPEAKARAISRANAGLAGNILFGGGIGAIIDHSKGTAYTYPTWIRMVFGKSLVFDRSAEKDGQPVVGAEPAEGTASAGNVAATAEPPK